MTVVIICYLRYDSLLKSTVDVVFTGSAATVTVSWMIWQTEWNHSRFSSEKKKNLTLVNMKWLLHYKDLYNTHLCNNVYMTCTVPCSATEHDQTEWKSSQSCQLTHKKKSWYDYSLFSPFEMHTDKSTNCTLLGPVDCDSFYKWIPLNRWPVAISSEVLHFIYCAFLSSLSLFNMCSSHYSLFFYSPPPSKWQSW